MLETESHLQVPRNSVTMNTCWNWTVKLNNRYDAFVINRNHNYIGPILSRMRERISKVHLHNEDRGGLCATDKFVLQIWLKKTIIMKSLLSVHIGWPKRQLYPIMRYRWHSIWKLPIQLNYNYFLKIMPVACAGHLRACSHQQLN